MATSAATIDLDDLDITKKAEVGYEFEFINEASAAPTGIFITVIGSHAPAVQNWVRKRLNAMRTREAMLKKKGKDDMRFVEDDEEFGIESAAVRVVGWRGITQECTKENVIKLCTINPEILAQIVKNSNELSNFLGNK